MKTPERFNRAIKALVQAFFKDNLSKGDCKKCAVGNICNGRNDWYEVFMTTDSGVQLIDEHMYFGETKNVIDSTGYRWEELAEIERSFETSTKIHWQEYYRHKKSAIMQDQFNGLMAVVEVLCKLDNIEPTEYKKAFEYTADFKPVTILSEVD